MVVLLVHSHPNTGKKKRKKINRLKMIARTAALLCIAATTLAVDPIKCVKDFESIPRDISVLVQDVRKVVEGCKTHNETECGQTIDLFADGLNSLVDDLDTALEDCGVESEACANDINAASAKLDKAVTDLTKASENCKKGGSKFQCIVDLEHTAEDIEHSVEDIAKAVLSCKKATNLGGLKCDADLVVIAKDAKTVTSDISKVAALCKTNKTECSAEVKQLTSDLEVLIDQADKLGHDCGETAACTADIDVMTQDLNKALTNLTSASTDCEQSSKTACVADIEAAAQNLFKVMVGAEKAAIDCKKAGTVVAVHVSKNVGAIKCLKDLEYVVKDVVNATKDLRAIKEHCKNATEADCINAIKTTSDALNVVLVQFGEAGVECGFESAACAEDIDWASAKVNQAVDDLTRAEESCKSTGSKFQCIADIDHTIQDLEEALGDVSKALISCKRDTKVGGVKCDLELAVAAKDAKTVTADLAKVTALCKTNKTECAAEVKQLSADFEVLLDEVDKLGHDCGETAACSADIDVMTQDLNNALTKVNAAATDCEGNMTACIADIESAGEDMVKVIIGAEKAAIDCKKNATVIAATGPEQCIKDIEDAARDVAVAAEDFKTVITTCKTKNETHCGESVDAFADGLNDLVDGLDLALSECGVESVACATDINNASASFDKAVTDLTKASEQCKKGGTTKFQCIVDLEHIAKDLGAGIKSISNARISCKKATNLGGLKCDADLVVMAKDAKTVTADLAKVTALCKTNKTECAAEVKQLTSDLEVLIDEADKLGHDCGETAACTADIDVMTQDLNKVLYNLTSASTDCEQSSKTACIADLEAATQNLYKVLVGAEKAAIDCKKALKADPVECIKDIEEAARDVGVAAEDFKTVIETCKTKNETLCGDSIDAFADGLNDLVDGLDLALSDCGEESVACTTDINNASASFNKAIDAMTKASEQCKKGGTTKFQCILDLDHIAKDLGAGIKSISNARISCKKALRADPITCIKDVEEAARDVSVAGEDFKTVIETCKTKNETLCGDSIDAFADGLNGLVDGLDLALSDCGEESVACTTDINNASASFDKAIDALTAASEQCKKGGTAKFQCILDLEHIGKDIDAGIKSINSARIACKKAAPVKMVKMVKVDPIKCVKDFESIPRDISVLVQDVRKVVEGCKTHNETECGQTIDLFADGLNSLVDDLDTALEDCGVESEACANDINAASAKLDKAVTDLTKASENCKKGGSKFQCIVDLEHTAEDIEHSVEDIAKAVLSCKKANKVGGVKCDLELVTAAKDAKTVTADLAKVAALCKTNKTECAAEVKQLSADFEVLLDQADKLGHDCGETAECSADIDTMIQDLNNALTKVNAAATDCEGGNTTACIADIEAAGENMVYVVIGAEKAAIDCKKNATVIAATGPEQCIKDVEDAARDVAVAAEDFKTVITTCKTKNETHCGESVDAFADGLNDLVDGLDLALSECGVESVACATDINNASASFDKAVTDLTKASEQCKKGGTTKFQCIVDLEHIAKDLGAGIKSISNARISCKKASSTLKVVVKKSLKALPLKCYEDIAAATHEMGVIVNDLAVVTEACSKNATNCATDVHTLADAIIALSADTDKITADCAVDESACSADIKSIGEDLNTVVNRITAADSDCKLPSKLACLADLESAATEIMKGAQKVEAAIEDCKA